MPYLNVKDFKLGMDRRRSKSAGTPGALWLGKNIHITRGGDIENAKKFVPTFTLPAGTSGLGSTRGQLFAFGSADLAASMPPGIQYQRLQANSAVLTRVLDVEPFAGKLYVIAEFNDGTTYHFYDGTRVTAWDTVSDANADYATLADYLADRLNNEAAVEASAFGSTILVTARSPGTAFTISRTATDLGSINDQTLTLTLVQANRPAVTEVQATGTFTITGGTSNPGLHQVLALTVNAVNILGGAVNWGTSNSVTAENVAAAITAGELTHGYSAVAVGAVITITAGSGTGTTPNGYVVSGTTGGDVTFSKTDMAGGVAAVLPLPQVYSAAFGGTFEALDKFSITINGTEYVATGRGAAAGTSALTYKKRIFSTAASLLRFSKLNGVTDWTDVNANTGAGFIAVSSDAEGYERVVGAAPFNTAVAVFARQNISLYTLGTDAAAFALDRPIENTGTRAARSIKGYGNNEVFYLDDSGVRSLRARQATDTPYAADVGSAIDEFIQEHIQSIAYDKVARAVSAIEPTDGRFWMAMGERIYVLSFYPSNKIQAWTYYEPGFEVTDFARIKSRLYARAGDTVYLYGGADGQTWPGDNEITCTVETPFISADTPASLKEVAGADFDLTNDWAVKVFPDPNRPDQYDTIGTVSKITGGQPHIKLPGLEASWAFTFECTKGGRATISSYAIHYNQSEAR